MRIIAASVPAIAKDASQAAARANFHPAGNRLPFLQTRPRRAVHEPLRTPLGLAPLAAILVPDLILPPGHITLSARNALAPRKETAP